MSSEAANTLTNFVPENGWVMDKFPFAASTAIAEGAAVGIEISSNTTTGNLTLMGTENTSGADFVGIMAEPIATTDSDYATAGKMKQVYIPQSIYSTAKFRVVNGTFTAADVWKTVQISSDSLGLDVDTAGKGARITKCISSTEGICTFPMPATETA